MGRAPCCDKANVKKGPWSPEEDARLKAYIEKFGTGGNWIALPQKIGLKRCGKSCRLRWLNYLRPNIKHGGFTEEEDNIICSLYISIGSRWSIIAAQLPGRTDNDIKNYWNTRLKKKLLGRRKQSSSSSSGGFSNINYLRNGSGNELDSEPSSNALSNSALERLQLHMQLLHQQQGLQNQNPYPNFYPWPTITTKLHHPQVIKNPNNNDHDHQSQQKDHHHDQLFYKPTLSSSPSVPFVAAAAAGDNDHQQVSDALQAELDEILRNNNRSMMMSCNNHHHQDDDQIQIADFDNSFAEMNSNNYMWWSNNININNDLMVKSSAASSSSTAPVLQQPEGMFQDNYEFPVPGYTL